MLIEQHVYSVTAVTERAPLNTCHQTALKPQLFYVEHWKIIPNIDYHRYVKAEGISKRGSSKTWNAQKGPLNLSLKLECLCLRAQTALKPTTVTCEMRICGEWTGLNASVKLLSRAYLQRMREACHRRRGVQYPGTKLAPTKPLYVHCLLRACQLRTPQRPAKPVLHPISQPTYTGLFAFYL